MAVAKRLRYEVLRRDDFKCRYCGGEAPDVKLTVDHVKPIALGGTDDADNLVTACAGCNSGKSSTTPDAPIVEDVAHDALRWRTAMEAAADLQAGHKEKRDSYIEAFEAHWNTWTYEWEGEHKTLGLPSGWRESVARFYDLGLEEKVLLDAVTIGMGKNHVEFGKMFKYFCGICWRILQERQDIAAGLLANEEGDA